MLANKEVIHDKGFKDSGARYEVVNKRLLTSRSRL
jgi:hypothetical protein